MITITCNPKPTIARLDKFKDRVEKGLGRLANEWGLQVVGHIKENYLSNRSKTTLGVVTGRLRSSIRYRTTEDSSRIEIAFGTDVPYGPIHEYGGRTPARVIMPRKAGGVISFLIGSRRVFARKVNHPGSQMPKRSFMRPGIKDKFQPLKQTVIGFLKEAANNNV